MKRINSVYASLIFLIIFMPSMSFGDVIYWSSGNYNAYSSVSMEYDGGLVYANGPGDVPISTFNSDLQISASLPLSSNASTEFCCIRAESSVAMTNSSFSIDLTTDADYTRYPPFPWGSIEYIWGEAYGSGEYNGLYSATLDYFSMSYSSSGNGGSLLVSLFDTTDDDYLLNTTLYLSSSTADLIDIYTPVGHDIQVQLKYSADADYGNDFSGSLSYDMTAYTPQVVPEPISSILFIVGGATLGFRRFRKKD